MVSSSRSENCQLFPCLYLNKLNIWSNFYCMSTKQGIWCVENYYRFFSFYYWLVTNGEKTLFFHQRWSCFFSFRIKMWNNLFKILMISLELAPCSCSLHALVKLLFLSKGLNNGKKKFEEHYDFTVKWTFGPLDIKLKLLSNGRKSVLWGHNDLWLPQSNQFIFEWVKWKSNFKEIPSKHSSEISCSQ